MSVFYEEYRALVDTVSNARDLLALANYAMDDTVHLTSYQFAARRVVERGSELRVRWRSQVPVLAGERQACMVRHSYREKEEAMARIAIIGASIGG